MNKDYRNYLLNDKSGKRKQGVVSWFNSEKGYGFLKDEDGRDVFIHFSKILMKGYKQLSKGDSVSYMLVETDKGPQAYEVLKLM